MTPSDAAVLGAVFLVGAVPTAYLVGRLHGVDIRAVGSGNVGATNVFRTLGKASGATTLVIDMLKGYLPVLWLKAHRPEEAWISVAAALAAVLGHIFTPFLNFKGGKGVATSGGVFLALLPVPTLLALAAFTLLFRATRKVSVGSLAAAVVLPLTACLLQGASPAALLAVAISVLVVVRHLSNIRRLVEGEEKGFGGKP